MSTSLAGGDHDLRSLAAIVDHERDDLPEQGVPLSLLSDLKDQIPCDCLMSPDETRTGSPSRSPRMTKIRTQHLSSS